MSFLQHDIGGAMDEVIPQAVRHRRQRAHAARHNSHSHRQKRPAGNRRALIVRRIGDRGEPLNLIDGVGGFVKEGSAAPRADDKVRLD
jgi:hypothetical protein